MQYLCRTQEPEEAMAVPCIDISYTEKLLDVGEH